MRTPDQSTGLLTYADLIDRITAWAANTIDVRAAMILGSRARSDHPADEWSDLDVLVFAHRSEQFIQTADWATTLAPHWLTFIERTGNGQGWERRTLYAGGLDVDVALFPVEGLAQIQQAIPIDVADIIRRGVKILIDKDGALAQILSMPLPQATLFQKPNETEFINAVGDFWYHTLWSAKHLRRGELWWAKSGVDMHLKQLLQQMLEWHAHAIKGEQFDTWLRGRFLEEWADPRAVKELSEVFAYYNAPDIARALRATMNIYRWLENETAARWNYSHPLEGEERATALTNQLLDEIKSSLF
jgi:aminoglycoside 6-adenylyltransferase